MFGIKRNARLLCAMTLAFALAAGCGNNDASGPDEDPEAFFGSNDVRITVGFGAGGGYDTLTRFIAQHLGKHLPGNPNVFVENMEGGGSLVAANHILNSAKRDGSEIGSIGSHTFINQMLGDTALQGDLYDLRWLGAYYSDISVCTARSDIIGSIEETLPPSSTGIQFGTEGPGSGTHLYAVAMNKLVGANVEVIAGYPGTTEIRLAVEQGELGGYCGVHKVLDRAQAEWEIDWNFAVQFASDSDLALAEVPNALDLVEGVDQETLELLTLPDQFFYPLVLPPDVPEERGDAIQNALEETYQDPDFLADIEKAQFVPGSPVTADQITELSQQFKEASPEVSERFQEVFGS